MGIVTAVVSENLDPVVAGEKVLVCIIVVGVDEQDIVELADRFGVLVAGCELASLLEQDLDLILLIAVIRFEGVDRS